MVLDIEKDKTVHGINAEEGYMELKAKATILAMGCKERTRGAINIPGDRTAGVFNAGSARIVVILNMKIIGY